MSKISAKKWFGKFNPITLANHVVTDRVYNKVKQAGGDLGDKAVTRRDKLGKSL